LRFASSRAILILAIAATLLVCSPAATFAAPDDPIANFDAHASRALDDWKVPAMAISAVKDGRVVFARGYGVRQLGGNARVDGETVFPIASITKAFIATAVAILVDEGRVQWTDPVIKKGTIVVGEIIERVSGQSWSDFVHKSSPQSRSPTRLRAPRSGHLDVLNDARRKFSVRSFALTVVGAHEEGCGTGGFPFLRFDRGDQAGRRPGAGAVPRASAEGSALGDLQSHGRTKVTRRANQQAFAAHRTRVCRQGTILKTERIVTMVMVLRL
jgi:hypothetical protein